jgi:hypothetical protein
LALVLLLVTHRLSDKLVTHDIGLG